MVRLLIFINLATAHRGQWVHFLWNLSLPIYILNAVNNMISYPLLSWINYHQHKDKIYSIMYLRALMCRVNVSALWLIVCLNLVYACRVIWDINWLLNTMKWIFNWEFHDFQAANQTERDNLLCSVTHIPRAKLQYIFVIKSLTNQFSD